MEDPIDETIATHPVFPASSRKAPPGCFSGLEVVSPLVGKIRFYTKLPFVFSSFFFIGKLVKMLNCT